VGNSWPDKLAIAAGDDAVAVGGLDAGASGQFRERQCSPGAMDARAGQDAEGQCPTQMKKNHTMGWRRRRASHYGAIVNANCFSLGNFNWHHPPERQEIGKTRALRLVKEGWLALG